MTLECRECKKPIAMEELIQVPLGIADPAMARTPMSGEPIAFHRACWEAEC